MTRHLPLLLGVLALLSACSESDNPMEPDPGPTGPPVIVSFTVTQTNLEHGEFTQLRWTIEGATVASISPDVGEVPSSGSQARSVRPPRSTTYEITASNSEGTVTATTGVTVDYPLGIFVDPVDGDDLASGRTPDDPVATLGHALSELDPGSSLYLAHGDYEDANIVIGTSRLLIFGALDPDTFFEAPGPGSWIRPDTGTPLTIDSASPVTTVVRNVYFAAPPSATAAVHVDSARLSARGCIFDGTRAGTGTAVRLEGSSEAEISHSQVRGGGTEITSMTETRGVHATGTTALRLTQCFVSGGSATFRATGVDLDTSGPVTIGLCTIAARITGGASADDGAAIRIWSGSPAIGGNVLFSRSTGGGASRHAVVEEAVDADPSWFEANLVVSAGTPAYRNEDGSGAFSSADLSNFQVIIGDGGVNRVSDNILLTGVDVTTIFRDVAQIDYHLRHPLQGGASNPAKDQGLRLHAGETYGSEEEDIDGDGRPSTYAAFDRGADEL